MCVQIIVEMLKQTNTQMFVCLNAQTNISTNKRLIIPLVVYLNLYFVCLSV
jgi:hypothetical protein